MVRTNDAAITNTGVSRPEGGAEMCRGIVVKPLHAACAQQLYETSCTASRYTKRPQLPAARCRISLTATRLGCYGGLDPISDTRPSRNRGIRGAPGATSRGTPSDTS